MRPVAITVLKDEILAPGAAIIRVAGIERWPENARLLIEPIDDAADGAADGWPGPVIVARETRITGSVVDLVVASEVVDAPALLPGTPVRFRVPAASIDQEMRWPRLPPPRNVRRAPGVMSIAQLRNAIALDAPAPAPLAAAAIVDAAAPIELRPRPMSAPTDGGLSALSKPAPDRQGAMLIAFDGNGGPSARDVPVRLPTVFAAGPDIQPPRMREKLSMGALLGGGVAAGVVLAGLLLTVLPKSIAGLGLGATTSANGPIPSLKAAFAVGDVSPRGRPAASVDSETALRLADFSLKGGAAGRDTAEASFWLRHALGPSLGEPHQRWALTQLGSTYADPASGAPDYARARALWEIAGSLGDPVAHCFIGHLHANGLGTAADPRAAQTYYDRAGGKPVCGVK